ncbi:hypothetical protein K7H92_21145, partial [Pseudomonas stutzeri]|nr:hypothetical protein [Stutzerimonas stutzeri]
MTGPSGLLYTAVAAREVRDGAGWGSGVATGAGSGGLGTTGVLKNERTPITPKTPHTVTMPIS